MHCSCSGGVVLRKVRGAARHEAYISIVRARIEECTVYSINDKLLLQKYRLIFSLNKVGERSAEGSSGPHCRTIGGVGYFVR